MVNKSDQTGEAVVTCGKTTAESDTIWESGFKE